MKKCYVLYGLTLFFFPTLLFADNFLCPTTNEYVETGTTLGQVLIACGQPTKVVESKNQSGPQQVTQLTYQRTVVKQNRLVANNMQQYQLDFQVADNKIIGILVNGQAVQATSCQNGSLKVGDVGSKILSQCGQPFLITRTMADVKTPQTTEIIYQTNSYLPPVTFIFQDGRLVGQKQ